jgi:hypothetical protein
MLNVMKYVTGYSLTREESDDMLRKGFWLNTARIRTWEDI